MINSHSIRIPHQTDSQDLSKKRAYSFLILLLGGVFFLSGCNTLAISSVTSPTAVEVKILQLSSSRQVGPGDPTRFTISLHNRGQQAVFVDQLAAEVEAISDHTPPNKLFSATWSYHGIDEKGIVIEPGKWFQFPIVPEQKEFPLGSQPPGDYDVRVTILNRFVSAPLKVRVMQKGMRRPIKQPDPRQRQPQHQYNPRHKPKVPKIRL